MKTKGQNRRIHLGLAVLALGTLALPRSAGAIRYVVTTVIGQAGSGWNGDGLSAAETKVTSLYAITFDPSGNLVFTDGNRVRVISKTNGLVSTIAGTGNNATNGDGVAATLAELSPTGIAYDASGNLYISDRGAGLCNIRKVTAGIISHYAGFAATCGGSDSPVTASSSPVAQPDRLACAGSNLYISETGPCRVRYIYAVDSNMYRLAGDGSYTYGGDGGMASDSYVNGPSGIAVLGNKIYFADRYNSRIRMVNSGTGIITTVAGTGVATYGGDEGPALGAGICYPSDVAVDAAGNLYIADSCNQRIRKVDADGNITTIAGTGVQFAAHNGDGMYGELTNIPSPVDIELGDGGIIYVVDNSDNRILKLSPAPEIILTKEATGTAAPNGTITYRISWSNNGAGTAYDLTITDSIPDSVQYVTPSLATHAQPDSVGTPVIVESYNNGGGYSTGEPPATTFSNIQTRWTISRVGVGKSGSVTFAVRARSTATNGLAIGNSVSATVMGMSFVFSSNTATTTINTGGATSSTVTGGSNTTALKDRLTTGSVLVAPNVIDLSRPGSAISLVVKSNKSADEVVIYDEEGNAVRTVTVSIGADGKGFVAFDGLADNDKKLSPGIYWVLLKGAPAGEKKRFIVVPKKK